MASRESRAERRLEEGDEQQQNEYSILGEPFITAQTDRH